MKNKQISKFIRSAAAAFVIAAALFSSCSREHLAVPGVAREGETVVTLSLKVPAAVKGTRALSKPDEDAVKSVEVLVFKNDEYRYTSHGKVTGEATVDVSLVKSVGANDKYDLVVLANSRSVVMGLSLTAGEKKDDVLASLVKSLDGKWLADPADHPGFPMSSDPELLCGLEIKEGMELYTTTDPQKAIALHRAVARINVMLGAKDGKQASDNFEITSISVYNRNTKAYLMGGRNADGYTCAPNAFTDSNVKGPLTYDEISGGASCVNEIYVFEAGNPADAAHTDRPCIVVGGFYTKTGGTQDTKETYYRLDFYGATNELGDVDENYLDILRNHSYNFTIKAVSGAGFESPEDAFNSEPFNMDFNIEVWDDINMNEIYFDGQSYFAIDKRTVTFSPMGDETVVYNVSTNIADWSMWLGSDKKIDAKSTATYINTDYGFEYEVKKNVGEDNKYTLTVVSSKHNIYSSENSRKENLTIKARLLSVPFTVEQLSTNLYISVVNGQSARLYPEGTQLDIKVPIDVVATKPVDITINGVDNSWLTIPSSAFSSLQSPDGNGLYKSSFNVDVEKWITDYNTGTRSATITIKPQGEEATVYTITQEAPYLYTSRPLEYILRTAPSYTCNVDIQTNIATQELLTTAAMGSSPLITASEGLITTNDPARPRNVRFRVDANMTGIAAISDEVTAQFDVLSVVYSLSSSSIFKVPSNTIIFDWQWNVYTPTSKTNSYIFPWNIETASVTFTSNNGLYKLWGEKNPFGVNLDMTEAASNQFPVTFTFPKVNHTTTDKYEVTFNNTNSTSNATVMFWSGFQQFKLANVTNRSLSYAAITNYITLADVYANVDWTATVEQTSPVWLTLREGASGTPTTVSIGEKHDKKTAPVARSGETYPGDGTTLDTKTTINYIVSAVALNGLAPDYKRTATVSFTNRDHVAAKYSPTIDPITITQYAPVLAYSSNTAPAQLAATSPAAFGITANTNLAGWTVKCYVGTEGVKTTPLTNGFSVGNTSPSVSASAAALNTVRNITVPSNGGGARKLSFYLSCSEFTGVEIYCMTVDQAAGIVAFDGHTGWAGCNIYWDGTKLTFDDVNVTTHEQYQGVYFKYGSLVAISPMGAWADEKYVEGSSKVLFAPTPSVWSSNNVTWANITPLAPISNSDRTRAYAYEKHDPANNIGDICKYITDKGWAPAGKWRLPTSKEFDYGMSNTTEFTREPASGGFSTQTPTNGDGTYSITSGRRASANNKSGDTTPFLPASGYRNYSDGSIYSQGTFGHYWSSSPNNTSNGYYLGLSPSSVTPSNSTYSSYGFAVRCVRQE